MFKQMLEEGYLEIRANTVDAGDLSRLEYLAEYIFDFTTYDSELSEEMAESALKVCKAINERATGELINNPQGYRTFIYMCNMDFFATKIEWGTSIRFPWWRHGKDLVFQSNGLWFRGHQLYMDLLFTAENWKQFISAVLEFSEKE